MIIEIKLHTTNLFQQIIVRLTVGNWWTQDLDCERQKSGSWKYLKKMLN